MAISNRQDELDGFKSQINLCEYAASHGFQLVRRQSSRHSAVMRHASGDKIVVARAANGHWIYFNPLDHRDHGTVIDFLQNRENISLGAVRKELRKWNGCQVTEASQPAFEELLPSNHDSARVLSRWIQASPVQGSNNYLEQQRCISPQVLADPVFRDRIRTDVRRNVVFPHWNSEQLCGYEIKNRNFTGFAPGGLKGLWCSRPQPSDDRLVICETAIDCLSYADLFGTHNDRFLSTAGQISPLQRELLRSAYSRMPADCIVVLAMDHDAGGTSLGDAIMAALTTAGVSEQQIVRQLPPVEGSDWNDALQASRQPPPSPAIG